MADSVAYLCPKVKENGKQCAAFLKWKQKFCKECGYLIPQKFWNEQQNDIRCGGIDENGEPCGQKLDLHDKFCSNCGKEGTLIIFFFTHCPLMYIFFMLNNINNIYIIFYLALITLYLVFE